MIIDEVQQRIVTGHPDFSESRTQGALVTAARAIPQTSHATGHAFGVIDAETAGKGLIADGNALRRRVCGSTARPIDDRRRRVNHAKAVAYGEEFGRFFR